MTSTGGSNDVLLPCQITRGRPLLGAQLRAVPLSWPGHVHTRRMVHRARTVSPGPAAFFLPLVLVRTCHRRPVT